MLMNQGRSLAIHALAIALPPATSTARSTAEHELALKALQSLRTGLLGPAIVSGIASGLPGYHRLENSIIEAAEAIFVAAWADTLQVINLLHCSLGAIRAVQGMCLLPPTQH